MASGTIDKGSSQPDHEFRYSTVDCSHEAENLSSVKSSAQNSTKSYVHSKQTSRSLQHRTKLNVTSKIRSPRIETSTSPKILLSSQREQLQDILDKFSHEHSITARPGQKRRVEDIKEEKDNEEQSEITSLKAGSKRLKRTTRSEIASTATTATTSSTYVRTKDCGKAASSRTSSYQSQHDRSERSRAPSPLHELDSIYSIAGQEQFLLGVGAQFTFRSALVMSFA